MECLWLCFPVCLLLGFKELYGVDWDGPADDEGHYEGVRVPNTLNPLSPQQYEALHIAVEQTDYLGLCFYLLVRQSSLFDIGSLTLGAHAQRGLQ